MIQETTLFGTSITTILITLTLRLGIIGIKKLGLTGSQLPLTFQVMIKMKITSRALFTLKEDETKMETFPGERINTRIDTSRSLLTLVIHLAGLTASTILRMESF